MAWSLSLAGPQVALEPAGQWWATVPREEWPDDPGFLAERERDFVEPHGDRRQELVFIGQWKPKERESLRLKLEDCLVNDQELSSGNVPGKNPFVTG